jgi:hypothetical protein
VSTLGPVAYASGDWVTNARFVAACRRSLRLGRTCDWRNFEPNCRTYSGVRDTQRAFLPTRNGSASSMSGSLRTCSGGLSSCPASTAVQGKVRCSTRSRVRRHSGLNVGPNSSGKRKLAGMTPTASAFTTTQFVVRQGSDLERVIFPLNASSFATLRCRHSQTAERSPSNASPPSARNTASASSRRACARRRISVKRGWSRRGANQGSWSSGSTTV